jgi:nicotinate phosphoribosyltransferase
MSRALVTDLYELNMAVSYLRRAMVGPATFSLFVRKLPPHRGFLVAAGLEDCLAFVESFAFADEDLAWLRRHGFEAGDVEALAGLRFTGDVHAVPEGRIVPSTGEPPRGPRRLGPPTRPSTREARPGAGRHARPRGAAASPRTG